MEQSPNPTRNLTSTVDPRSVEIPRRPKRPTDELASSRSEIYSSHEGQIFGMDKTMLMTFAALGLSMAVSMYLFREFRKLKDEVRVIKSQDPDSDLFDKVEENSESVKAIEIKLDQLILAISNRERKFQQAQMAVNSQQQVHQQVHQQQAHQQQAQQMQQTGQQAEYEYYEEEEEEEEDETNMQQTAPVMGGRIAGTGVVDNSGVITI